MTSGGEQEKEPKKESVVGSKEGTTAVKTKEPEVQIEPSPQDPILALFQEAIIKSAGEGAIREAYINRVGEHVPTLVIRPEKWLEVATLLRKDPIFELNYMRNLSAVDYTTHMEMVYVLYSFSHHHQIAIRVPVNRENPAIATVSHLWDAANWNERECYDLFGIVFENHPNLKRILLPDQWEGFPLRKDYEQLDKEI